MEIIKNYNEVKWISEKDPEVMQKTIIGMDICKSSNIRIIKMRPGRKAIPHGHEQLQVYYILQGKAKVRIESNIYDVEENFRIIIKPNQIHSVEAIGDKELILLIFDEFDLCLDFNSPYVDY